MKVCCCLGNSASNRMDPSSICSRSTPWADVRPERLSAESIGALLDIHLLTRRTTGMHLISSQRSGESPTRREVQRQGLGLQQSGGQDASAETALRASFAAPCLVKNSDEVVVVFLATAAITWMQFHRDLLRGLGLGLISENRAAAPPFTPLSKQWISLGSQPEPDGGCWR